PLDRRPVFGLEGEVERRARPSDAEPELGRARPAEPGRSRLIVARLEAVPERLEGRAIEADAPGEIRDRQSDVIEHVSSGVLAHGYRAGPRPSWRKLRCLCRSRLRRGGYPSRIPGHDGGRAADELRSGHLADGR